jgi:hypothetical protein
VLLPEKKCEALQLKAVLKHRAAKKFCLAQQKKKFHLINKWAAEK